MSQRADDERIARAARRFVANLMQGAPDNDPYWAEDVLRDNEYGHCLICLAEPRHEPDCPLVGLVRLASPKGVTR